MPTQRVLCGCFTQPSKLINRSQVDAAPPTQSQWLGLFNDATISVGQANYWVSSVIQLSLLSPWLSRFLNSEVTVTFTLSLLSSFISFQAMTQLPHTQIIKMTSKLSSCLCLSSMALCYCSKIIIPVFTTFGSFPGRQWPRFLMPCSSWLTLFEVLC